MPPLGVEVQRGPTLDGLGHYYAETIEESDAAPVDVAVALAASGADVLVCYLPVGSEDAARYYAEQALKAGVAFVNCLPVFIAGRPEWAERFTRAGVPIIGDDIKSQVGATIVHRVLSRLMEDRGIHIDRTYQLNFGGNMDFMNMLERSRLESKKISKTQAVTSQVDHDLGKRNVHVGPSDYVPWLDDRKWCYIRVEGRAFGDVPINLELKLEVWDSPNSAGVVIDAVRCAKLALDRGIGGPLLGPAAYFMKSPPVQYTDDEARRLVEEFAAGADTGRPPVGDNWWRHGVIYQIYPRSFADANGDGVGDLAGITAKLDHLNDGTPRSLGVDAVWLSPFYPSPMADFGYDVADYTGVDPIFGTLDDADRLIAEAHARGIRVLVDLVPNHTSDQHPGSWSRARRGTVPSGPGTSGPTRGPTARRPTTG